MDYDDLLARLSNYAPSGSYDAERAESWRAITALQARVAELDLQRNQAIAEIAVWAQDCGKAQADLATARALLREANEMLAEAIVCGPKLREYTPLRQRIAAALAGEKK